MTPEDVNVFNHNVQVQNYNSQLFENITRAIIEVNDNIIQNFTDMLCYEFLKSIFICLLLIGILLEIQSLENKVTKLERDKI